MPHRSERDPAPHRDGGQASVADAGRPGFAEWHHRARASGAGLIGQGATNTEIAERMHITMPTVKSYVGRLMTKLAARDRVQLVIVAYRTGLVTP